MQPTWQQRAEQAEAVEADLRESVEALRNGLAWIYHIAGMHYIGGAFDTKHMRALANLAADALDYRELPDYDEAMKEARERAEVLIERLAFEEPNS